jgi:predicted ester cyclase
MTQEEIARSLEAYRLAKDSHDVQAVIDLRTEDCVDHTVATDVRLEGKAAIARYFTAFFDAVPDYRGKFEGAAYGTDCAVVWGHFVGTVSQQLFGVRVDGSRRLHVPCVFVLTFRDGQVVEDRMYWDAATVAEQLGLAVETIRAPKASP